MIRWPPVRGCTPLFSYQGETKDLRTTVLDQGETKGLADFCTLFYGGFVRYCRFFGCERAGKFYLSDFVEEGGVAPPLDGFALGFLLRLGEETTDVGEGAGTAGRDAVGGKGGKEIAEHVVDIDLGDENAAGTLEFFGEIVFALRRFGVLLASVAEAESIMLGAGGETTHAAVGEFLGAEVECVVGSCVRHKGKCGG